MTQIHDSHFFIRQDRTTCLFQQTVELRAAIDELFPVGAILPFGSDASPVGFLICDGSAVSRDTYSTLFAIIGETFGPGDGINTFNLPDLQEQFVYGKESGSGTPEQTVGASVGTNAPSHTHMTCNHNHTTQVHNHAMGLHSHGICSHFHQVCSHQHGTCNHRHRVCSHSHGVASHKHTACNHSHYVGTTRIYTPCMAAHSHGGAAATEGAGAHNHGSGYSTWPMCSSGDGAEWVWHWNSQAWVGDWIIGTGHHDHCVSKGSGTCGCYCYHGHGNTNCEPNSNACAPGSTGCEPYTNCQTPNTDFCSPLTCCNTGSVSPTDSLGSDPYCGLTQDTTVLTDPEQYDNIPESTTINFIIKVQ